LARVIFAESGTKFGTKLPFATRLERELKSFAGIAAVAACRARVSPPTDGT